MNKIMHLCFLVQLQSWGTELLRDSASVAYFCSSIVCVCTVWSRVPPGPYKSLKVLKFHTFKYKALKSP